MKTTRLDEAFVVMSDERMTGRRLYASPAAVIVHMTVHPGREVEPHSADVDLELFVISGKGRFSVGDEYATAGPGVLIECPADIPHGIANTGDLPLELLVVKNGKGQGRAFFAEDETRRGGS